MKISQEGISLIKKFEGFESDAYQCPAGVWTIGYGHTKGVTSGDVWSEEHASHILEVKLNQNQFDALVAWVYNLGPSNLKSSTMLKVLNEEEWEEVPRQMKRWNKAGGEVLRGLVRRREAEAMLFQGKDWYDV